MADAKAMQLATNSAGWHGDAASQTSQVGSLECQLTSQQSISPWDGATPHATDRVALPPTTIASGDAHSDSSPAGDAAAPAELLVASGDQPEEPQASAEPGSPAAGSNDVPGSPADGSNGTPVSPLAGSKGAPEAEPPAAARPVLDGNGEAGTLAASREKAAEMHLDDDGASVADVSQAFQMFRDDEDAGGASGPSSPLDANTASSTGANAAIASIAVASTDYADAADVKANHLAHVSEASDSDGSSPSPMAAREDADKSVSPAPADLASPALPNDDAASPSESDACAAMEPDEDAAPAATTQLPRDGANGAVLWSQANGSLSEPSGQELAPFPVGPTPAAPVSSAPASAAEMLAGASSRASMNVDNAALVGQAIKHPEPEAPGVDAPSSPPLWPPDVAPNLVPLPQAASHSDSSGDVGGAQATPQLFFVRRERAEFLLDSYVGIESKANLVTR